MKIKTSITEEREIEITLPIFRKEIGMSSTTYMGVIEASHVIEVYQNDEAGHTRVSIVPMWIKTGDVAKAVNSWQEIDEYEFLQAHEDALQSLSLAPKLCEIDREIEDELNDLDDLQNVL